MDNTVPSTEISLNYNAAAGRPLKRIEALNQRKKWLHDGNKWDDITPSRDLPTNIKYMVVDIETHDWTSKDPLLSTGSCIVEIAWKLFSDEGDCLESKQYLIQPYGTYKEIAPKATEVHGITTKHASKHGVDVELVLDELIRIVGNIPNDGFVVAHNMAHEHTVLTNSFSPDQRDVWDAVQKSDTHSVPLLKYLPHEAKVKYETELRWVPLVGFNLQRLHECVYQGDVYVYEYAHFAETDVKMTWEIFRYYKQHATVEELTWTNPSVEGPQTFLNRQVERNYNVRRLRLPPLSRSSVLGGALV